MNILNLISAPYCLSYKHLSNKANEVHFQITFGATVIYQRYADRTFWQNLFNISPELIEIARKKVSFSYIKQNVNWYYFESGEQASIDEQTRLNQVQVSFVDRFFPKGDIVKNIPQLIGEERIFPRNTVSVLIP